MGRESRIKPISYLNAHSADVILELGEGAGPLVVTQNGEAKAVLQDVGSFEATQEALALLKLLAMSRDDIGAGRVKPPEGLGTGSARPGPRPDCRERQVWDPRSRRQAGGLDPCSARTVRSVTNNVFTAAGWPSAARTGKRGRRRARPAPRRHCGAWPVERGPVPPELDALGIRSYRQLSLPPWRIIYRSGEGSVRVMLVADARCWTSACSARGEPL